MTKRFIVVFLTPDETAARLRVAHKTLANWRVSGDDPHFIKAGKRVISPLAEIESWEGKNLKSHTRDDGAGRED